MFFDYINDLIHAPFIQFAFKSDSQRVVYSSISLQHESLDSVHRLRDIHIFLNLKKNTYSGKFSWPKAKDLHPQL